MINDKRERRGALFVSLESKVASVHVKVPGLSSLVRCNGEQSRAAFLHEAVRQKP